MRPESSGQVDTFQWFPAEFPEMADLRVASASD